MRLRQIRCALLVLPVSALALAAVQAPADAARPPGWRISATIAVSANSSLLASIAVGDRRHAWAVGVATNTTTSSILPLVATWNGSVWRQVSLPAPVVAALGPVPLLTTAGASGPANMWAFSLVGGRWLRWNGTSWTAGRITTAPVQINASVVLGSKNVWAFGREPSAGSGPRAFHYDGTAWKRSVVPGSNGISAASAVSSEDIWAVLGSGDFLAPGGGKGGGLVHWFRGRWHTVSRLPSALRNASLGSILARGDRNVWVGGATKNAKHGTTEAVGHWNGHRWKVVTFRAPASSQRYQVVSLVTDGAGGIWALGDCLSSARNCAATSPWRLWHEAAGKWSAPIKPRLSSHNTLLVSLASVAHSVWAPGAIQEGRSSNGMIALWGIIPR